MQVSPIPIPLGQLTSPVMEPAQIMNLAYLATAGIVIMWIAFWILVYLKKESIQEILLSPAFFKAVAVIGVVAATAVLALAQRLEPNLTGAILSGTIGYVLGTVTSSREVGQGTTPRAS